MRESMGGAPPIIVSSVTSGASWEPTLVDIEGQLRRKEGQLDDCMAELASSKAFLDDSIAAIE